MLLFNDSDDAQQFLESREKIQPEKICKMEDSNSTFYIESLKINPKMVKMFQYPIEIENLNVHRNSARFTWFAFENSNYLQI